jgi:hypothetical protein
VTSSSIQVLWIDNSANEGRFEVARLAAGNTNWAVAFVAANRTDWTLRWQPAGATYTFVVRACNLFGCSPWSDPVTGTTSG